MTNRKSPSGSAFHLRTHDVLILSGGVSMGKLDLVPKVLEKLGVNLVFHHVAQRPGKPMWFGVSQSGPAVFALPGNPVSTLVCLSRYVLPALRAAMGQAPVEAQRIALTAPVEVKAPLAFYMPVKLKSDDWGRTSAEPKPTNGSGDFTSWPVPTDSSNCRRGPTRFRKASWRDSSVGEGRGYARKNRCAESRGQCTRTRRCPAAADSRPAHLGHGPLQFPLPVLHAARDLSRVVSIPQDQ
jgi:hypothetical protein